MPLAKGQRHLYLLTSAERQPCTPCLADGQPVNTTRAVVTAHHYTGRDAPLPLCLSHAAMLRGEAEVSHTLTHKPTGRKREGSR